MHVELAAHAVDLPAQVAVLQLGDRVETPAAARLQVDVADDDPAEVREVRDVAAASPSDENSATAPTIITKYLAGIWKRKYR